MTAEERAKEIISRIIADIPTRIIHDMACVFPDWQLSLAQAIQDAVEEEREACAARLEALAEMDRDCQGEHPELYRFAAKMLRARGGK